MNYHKRPSHESAHKHSRNIDISIYLHMKRIGLNITNTFKILARIASHLFLKPANVPFLLAINFSVSNLLCIFFKKNIKIGINASFFTFPNTQFSEIYKIVYKISPI